MSVWPVYIFILFLYCREEVEEDQHLSAGHMYGDDSMNIERGEEETEKMMSTGNMSGDGSVMGIEQGAYYLPAPKKQWSLNNNNIDW